MRDRLLLGLLILSGYTGLAYELLWVRLLALGFGSTTLSFATVLAVFFGGLALGAWLGGRTAHRIDNPIRAYALLEIGTGILALLAYPLILNVGELFARIDPGSGFAGGVVRALVATPLLLGPTVLMGATLPWVTRAIVIKDEAVGSGSALIYAFNTLGAFLGAYGVTYLLLPVLGVFGSTLLTVGVNFFVGAVAWALGAGKGGKAIADPRQERGQDEIPSGIRRTGTILAFLVGFAAICFQVVWVRMMSIYLDGTVYGVGSVLICVLLGIGLGSLVVARGLRRSRDTGLWFAALQLVTLVSVMLVTSNLEFLAYVLRTAQEEFSGLWVLHVQLAVVLSFLLIPSLASGASFPVLVQLIERRAAGAARSVAGLYTSNTVGSICGSLLTGFVLLPYAGSSATIILGITVVALVGATAAILLASAPMAVRACTAALPLLAVSIFEGFDPRVVSMAGVGSPKGVSFTRFKSHLDRRKQRSIFFSEGKSATVVLNRSAVSISLQLNGLGQGARLEFPPHHIFESLMVAYVPYAYAPSPRRGLVVGLGAGITVDALLELGVDDLTVVELEPKVVEALDRIFPPTESPLQDPRVQVEIGDARHHLLKERISDQEGYDLITSMPAHPWVASNIFTQEFFELARDNLSERGVFSTWFGLGRLDQQGLGSLVRAFTQTFPHYVVHQVNKAGALYLVGSNQPLRLDMVRLRELSERPMLAAHTTLSDARYLPAQVVGVGTPDTPELAPGVVNTDDSAYVELYTPRTSSVAPPAHDLFPVPHLTPELLEPAAQRAEEAKNVLEYILRTPEGAPPLVSPGPVPIQRVEHTLKALGPILSDPDRRYFEGRLALIRGKREEARRIFLRLSEEQDHPGARTFLPFTYRPKETGQEQAFLRAPSRGRVWAPWLQIQGPKASQLIRAKARQEPPSSDDLLARLILTGGTASATVAESASAAPLSRTEFARLASRVQRSPNLPLLELALEEAESRGFEALLPSLLAARTELTKKKAQGLARLGRQLGQRGKPSEAAAKLTEALALHPLDKATQWTWLVSLIQSKNVEKIQQAADQLRVWGWEDVQIEFAQRMARDPNAKFDLSERPAQQAPEEDVVGAGQPVNPD